MPNSSPNDPNQLEDIFADAGPNTFAAPLEPASVEPVTEAVEVIPTSNSMNKRRVLIIATCVLALLLLGAGGVAVWLWLQGRELPTENVTNTNVPPTNTEVINTNDTITTNANEVVNVNTVVPTNTNPITNSGTFVDVDHDGLSDEEELIENTNPKKKDTDEDGLSDREEVRVYNTDPRNPDTDNDSYSDGDEVTHFYHPNHPDPKKRLFDLPQ